ncbi:MAG: HPP family protein [Methylococcaceae bacterium]
MTLHQLIYLFSNDPIHLSIKGKCLAVLSCFMVILSISLLSSVLIPDNRSPILVASMGASAVIVFIIPNSSLAQPWPLVGGQIISALAGMSSALLINNIILAASVAVASSILLMLLLRCLHPPGAATALAPVLGGHSITALGYSYVLFPVAINVLIMLLLAILINRYIMAYNYPILTISPDKTQKETKDKVGNNIGLSQQDINKALAESDVFMDITAMDLNNLLIAAQAEHFKRLRGVITCKDIMLSEVITVEYGTEVQEAWQLMLKHNLKAIPVIDRARRVIGMVTWHDFFKFINLNSYHSLSEKILEFIARTPDVTTQKPEAVGHIMSRTVTVLADSCHIIELIPLMSQQGHRQIPIVNDEQRLVGIINQPQLIAALYQQQLLQQ